MWSFLSVYSVPYLTSRRTFQFSADLQVSGTILGTVKTPAADPCTPCVAGKYLETAGLSVCDNCQEGKYSETVGSESSSNCLDCQVGRYSEQLGADSLSDCFLCGQGKFLNTIGELASDSHKKASKAKDSSEKWKRGEKQVAN